MCVLKSMPKTNSCLSKSIIHFTALLLYLILWTTREEIWESKVVSKILPKKCSPTIRPAFWNTHDNDRISIVPMQHQFVFGRVTIPRATNLFETHIYKGLRVGRIEKDCFVELESVRMHKKSRDGITFQHPQQNTSCCRDNFMSLDLPYRPSPTWSNWHSTLCSYASFFLFKISPTIYNTTHESDAQKLSSNFFQHRFSEEENVLKGLSLRTSIIIIT